MKSKDKKILIFLLLLSIPIGCFIMPKSYNQFSELITFLSILIGFQITALSILFNSRILKILYDNKNKVYRTELNRLKSYFSYSIYFEIVSIVVLLIMQDNYLFSIKEWEFGIYKSYLVLPIITGSVYCFLKISNDFFRIFVLPRNE
jgi:hypothetical protein